MSQTIIITGGGTGGHLSVARSFIDEFYQRGYKVIYIGSTKGQDKDWFENDPKISSSFFLQTRGVVNQALLGKAKSLFLIFQAILHARKIIKKNNVSKVISVGGFSAAPASFAAIATKTDFYIHEQNSVMGKLNSITSKFAKEVFSSYLQNSKVKDYPINEKFFDDQRVRSEVKTVIFLGGSQGARAINDFALKVAPKLKELGIEVIHQTGQSDYKRVKEEYKKLGLHVDLFDFSKELLEKMQYADFAVSRAGASTLWELAAMGIPTLFIPYPYAAADHQYHNAKYLLEKNLCFLQREKELNDKYFFEIIQKDMQTRSRELIDTIHKDAVKNIVDIIEQ